MFQIQDINEYFRLPIYYEEKSQDLTKHIIDDFHFDQSNNPYQILFASKKYTNSDKNYNVHKIVAEMWKNQYSTDKKFLKNLQEFISQYKFDNTIYYRQFVNKWLKFKNETSFKKKYEFFDWSHLEFLNKNETALQCINYINVSSPIISLLIPFILFLIPLVVLFLRNNFSLNEYIELVKKQFSNHAFGKIFKLFGNNISTSQKMYTSLGVAFYFFTSYQNVLLCIKSYRNASFIQKFLFQLKSHLAHTLDLLNYNIELCEKCGLSRYSEYLTTQRNYMTQLYDKTNHITSDKLGISILFNIGSHMKLFYELFDNESIHKLMMFSFGVNAFSENIEGLVEWINREKLKKCEFSNSKKQQIKNSKYIYFIENDDAKSNLVNLSHNYIIHGPNASGKTTYLKSAFLNILFSQQFGFGYYDSCIIPVFNKLYSYINIPDTSDRDSLFQAEARRCLDIINDVNDLKMNKKDERQHYFAIFDELYSGTNPNEATLAAKGYLKYLEKIGVRFVLTSHFKELEESNYLKHTKNYFMNSINKDGKIEHTYKLKKGRNNVVGGFEVLTRLGYPDEIIQFMNN